MDQGPDPNARHGKRFEFRARYRIVRSTDFDHIMRTGRRVTDDRLLVWGLRNGLDVTRLGLTVGRKHGHALRRNRIKRLLREAFRLMRPELPVGLDLVCAPRAGSVLTLERCRQSIARLVGRLDRRLRRDESEVEGDDSADGR